MDTEVVIALGIFGVIALPILLGAFLVFVCNVDLEIAGPAIFSLIGIGMLGMTIYISRDTARFVRQAVQAEGIVVDFESHRSKDSDGRTSTTYAPVVRFRTATGKVVQFKGLGSSPPEHEEGDKLPVLYLSASPDKARINSFRQLWLAPSIFGGIGLIFSLIGFGCLIAFYRQSRNR